MTSTCEFKSIDTPHMMQPLSIIRISIGVSVNTMTVSQVLNPQA